MQTDQGHRLSTRLAFLVAGFIMAAWAPLVPFAKANTGVDEAQLGLLLLCIGIGSLVAMPVTGIVSARSGPRPMILLGGTGLVVTLPVLAVLSSPLALGAALLVFGASLGTIDVAMNIHAVEVEKRGTVPLMSGFHAMFSIGGFAGAGGMTLALSQGLAPLPAAGLASLLAAAALALAAPRFLAARAGEPPRFALPRGIVLLIALLTAITFLVEGAVLDWSALLLLERSLTSAEQAGLAYMLFSVAMTVGRLTGDRIVAALGPLRILLVGGIVTIAGIALVLLPDARLPALSGFVLIGIGASNIVPVLFSLAGRQKVFDPGLAIAAVTTCGYAGILAGPALIGFAAHLTSLPAAFWLLAGLMALVPLAASRVTR